MATPSQPSRRDNDRIDPNPQQASPSKPQPGTTTPDENARRERSAASQSASGPAERHRQNPSQGEPRRAIWQDPERPERAVPDNMDDDTPSQRTSSRQDSKKDASDDDDSDFRNL